MTSVISKFVIKTLCDNQGCLDFKRLEEKLAQHFTVADQVLRSVLFDDGRIAILDGGQVAVGGHITSGDSVIVAKTSLRICQSKSVECAQCNKLHLCRYYVCGDCSFGPRCKNPHSLADPHNAELLKRYDLHDLTEKQLFQLLLQNDPYLLPEVCLHYNKGNGLYGSCKFTTSCTKLHVCQHYLQGDCTFGSACKRSHNVAETGAKFFRGFSQENLTKLLEIYRNKSIIMGQQERGAAAVPAFQQLFTTGPACPSKPLSDADRSEICLFFIRRNCSFKDMCARVHWHLPYRWQVSDRDGVTWKDLPNMENIEKTFCDPGCDKSCAEPPSPTSGNSKSVDFTTMTYAGSPVHRLSTASSASKPPHYVLTTQWLWYWKDDSGRWQEFGQGDGDCQASVTSQTLENVYLADREAEIPFCGGKQQYVLHLKGTPMYQQNIKHKTRREVRRRPRFVSARDVELKLNSASSHSSSSSTADSVPPHWDKHAQPDFGYKLVSLSKPVKEYIMIERLFKRTMPRSKINSIKRIQNPSLWRVFQWQKEQMKERNGGKPVNEQYLFHGTNDSLIKAICEQNFDWRMCGVHGTSYGKGSYFARDASYSDRYATTKTNSSKIIFVALVLVGEFTRGSSSYVRPPPKGNGTTLYDSCVDVENNPSIYVIFEKQQVYPEYLIHYT